MKSVRIWLSPREDGGLDIYAGALLVGKVEVLRHGNPAMRPKYRIIVNESVVAVTEGGLENISTAILEAFEAR